MLKDIRLEQVVEVLKKKNYIIYEDHRPNIVGIRSKTRSAGTYDDTCVVWWKDGNQQRFHTYTITTDPGLTYMKYPLAGTKGTAILVPGQYVDCYQLGLHRGKQKALIQTGGKVKVYRDNNKDGILNTDPSTIQEGYFGINLHHGSISDAPVINGWSAGCQVWRYNRPHQELIENFRNLSQKHKFNRFTYTLILEEDVK